MKATEVDAIVRSVIIHLGLPFAVLSVAESPAGWNIQVRAGTAGVVRFTVLCSRSIAMRLAIQQKLQAVLQPLEFATSSANTPQNPLEEA